MYGANRPSFFKIKIFFENFILLFALIIILSWKLRVVNSFVFCFFFLFYVFFLFYYYDCLFVKKK